MIFNQYLKTALYSQDNITQIINKERLMAFADDLLIIAYNPSEVYVLLKAQNKLNWSID